MMYQSSKARDTWKHEGNPRAVLNMDIARLIRAEWMRPCAPSKRALARRYSVTDGTIRAIIDGRIWRDDDSREV